MCKQFKSDLDLITKRAIEIDQQGGDWIKYINQEVSKRNLEKDFKSALESWGDKYESNRYSKKNR